MIRARLPQWPLRWGVAMLLSGAAMAQTRLPPRVVSARGSITKTGNNYDIQSGLGVRMGPNLFHTFIQFDLAENEVATFGGAAGVSNILARVTGSRSFIDGTIRSSSPDTRLFLMNARGVTFERHAQLDVAGSFAVTTADYLKLEGGGRFDALDATKDSLTVGAVSAFGFLGKQSSSITVAPRTNLAARAGQSLTFAGGSVDLSGGDADGTGITVQTPQGHLALAAVTKGELPVSLGPGPKLGEVTLKNAALTAGGTGRVSIRGGRLTMSQASAQSGGAMDIRVRGAATVSEGSTLYTTTDGSSRAGDFALRAGSLSLTGGSEAGSLALANATAGGGAGRVSVVTGNLTMRDASKIQSSTRGAAAAGAVDVRAAKVRVNGDFSSDQTGIFSNSIGATGGHSGAVRVTAGSLQLTNGGLISGDTFGSGAAGNVTVQVTGAIAIAANGAEVKTGVFSDSFAATGGNGGDVRVTAGSLDIRNGGLISTKTVGSGHGGDTFVRVRDLTIARGASDTFTGIAADSATNDSPLLPAHAAGPGGNVRVTAQTARIFDGGQISASTATQGKGGSVFVNVEDLMLDGHRGDAISAISADSRAAAGRGGAGGDVQVIADRLSIADGARISATTFGLGAAGAVHVEARTAEFTAAAGEPFTGLLAVSASPTLAGAGGSVHAQFGQLEVSGRGGITGNTLGPGRGGDVVVTAGRVRLLDGGQISANTAGLGRGGNVDFTTDELAISGRQGARPSGISSGSSAEGLGGAAGSVFVKADSIQMADDGGIAATSSSSGRGGSVVVEARRLTLDRGASIAASALGAGDAGSVSIAVSEPLKLRGGSSISTTSAISNAGTVAIDSRTDVVLEKSDITVQAAQGNAGRLALRTRHLLYMQNSQLLAEAGLNGGDIFVDPVYIVLDQSRISANAVFVGGNILLSADNFLSSESLITATGSTAGTVQITAPQLDLSGALAVLTAQLVDASIRFQERCAMRLGADVSSFLVLGRGGVEDAPSDPAMEISLRARAARPAPAMR